MTLGPFRTGVERGLGWELFTCGIVKPKRKRSGEREVDQVYCRKTFMVLLGVASLLSQFYYCVSGKVARRENRVGSSDRGQREVELALRIGREPGFAKRS